MRHSPAIPWNRYLETAAFFVLAVVAVLRPLVAESYDSAGSAFAAAIEQIADPTPVRTIGFDLAILAGVSLWSFSRMLGPRRRWSWTGLEAGAALIAVGAVVSSLAAGNQRLAINASVDWLCLPLMAIALADLCRMSVRRRVLAAALLGAACVQAGQCYEYYFVSAEQTWQEYEKNREQIWAARGIELDSPEVELFERRIRSREAQGFFPHSNVTGSYLLLCGFSGLGVAVGHWRRSRSERHRLAAFAAGALAILVVAAVVLTGSLGAMLLTAGGVLFAAIVCRLRDFLVRRRRAVLIASAVGFAVVAAGYVGYGRATGGSFPHMSLTFRWDYWTAAAEMTADHPWTGVGRENFGRHYLQYKTIQSPEEVSNPHNLLLHAASEWGIFGLLGLVLMIGGGVAAATRPGDRAHPGARPEGDQARAGPAVGSSDSPVWVWGVALAVTMLLIRLPLLGSDDPNFLYYSSVTAGLLFVAGFAAFAGSGDPWATATDLHQERAAPGLATILPGVGLLLFLLHELINFALFVPGAGTTFFALVGLQLSLQTQSALAPAAAGEAAGTVGWKPVRLLSRDGAFAAGGMLAMVFVAAFVLRPVLEATRAMQDARSLVGRPAAGPIEAQPPHRLFAEAVAADPLDPTPPLRLGQYLAALAQFPAYRQEALQRAAEAMRTAVERDPFSASIRRTRAAVLGRLGLVSGKADDWRAAIEAAEKGQRLYPSDPDGWVLLGDILEQAAGALDDGRLAGRAVAAYESALALDAARPPWAELNRFSERRAGEIRAAVERLRPSG